MIKDLSSLTGDLHDVLAPLEAEEQQRAITAALAASHENLLVRGAELAIDKSANRRERPHRRVRVLLSAPDECVAREVLVDPDGNVIADRDLGPRNLPYLASEIEQARAIAERDEQVARLFARYTVGVGTFAPMLGGAGRHRLGGFHFLPLLKPPQPPPRTTTAADSHPDN